MSVITAVREYINKMLSEVLGMKALLMDEDTIGIVSMVFSQSESNAKEVFLFQSIDSDKKSEVSHLKAVVFVRPTAKNIAAIVSHLREPRFAEYHLYFTNIVPKSFLKQIAEADDQEAVRSVQEYFADFFAVNSDLFTLNIEQTRLLNAPHWGPQHNSTFTRIVDGLASTLLSFKKAPVIRYAGASDVCKKVATELTARTKEENGLFDFPRSDGVEPLLLILDRRCDPVTPLLMQWTYQALVHELLGLHNHRVDLSGVQNVQKEFREVVLSPEADHFFKGVMYQNWGDVASQIHELITQYARQNKDNRKMQTFEEMKDFVENYPQFKQLQTNACKHMTVATELHKKIDQRHLLEVCELEQELACVDSHSNSVEKLLSLLNDGRISDSDKLRCALLYALRYESVRNELPTIKQLLRSKARDANARSRVELVDLLLEYSNSASRGSDLFAQSVAAKASKFFELFSSDFQGAESALTMHKPYLNEIIAQLNNKTLKTTEFPYIEGDQRRQFNHKFIIVFFVGGATFEEAAAVAALNAANPNQRIILGGTFIHNSQSFLADVSGGFHTSIDVEHDMR